MASKITEMKSNAAGKCCKRSKAFVNEVCLVGLDAKVNEVGVTLRNRTVQCGHHLLQNFETP